MMLEILVLAWDRHNNVTVLNQLNDIKPTLVKEGTCIWNTDFCESYLFVKIILKVILFQTINTVSEVIRGNLQNQEYFASVMAPSTPPR